MEFEVTLIVVCVLVVATNMAVICMVMFIKELRTFTNYFVLSLAISDLLMGGVLVPLNHPWVPSSVVTGYTIIVIMLSGVGNICALTWDRYVAVMEPFAYKNKLEIYYKKILMAVWMTAISCSLFPLAWKTDQQSVYHKVYLVTTILACVVFSYFAIGVAYIRIFMRLRYHSAQLERGDIPSSQSEGTFRMSLEGKTVKVFLVVVVLFLLSWVPVIYMTVVSSVIQKPHLIPSHLPLASLLMLALSSLVDPILYAFLKRDFNKQIRSCFKNKGADPVVLTMATTSVTTLTDK